MKRIIFRKATSTRGKDDVVMEDYELDFYIYATIQTLSHTVKDENSIIVLMNPKVLDFIKYSDFSLHLHEEISNSGIAKYSIYNHRILISEDCLLKVVIDPLCDTLSEYDAVKI